MVTRVYPRTYGGTSLLCLCFCTHVGLSPHIRGNVYSENHDSSHLGSIPAHTGERLDLAACGSYHWVYPRTYGGTNPPRAILFQIPGLSPHIRGNGSSKLSKTANLGSIPAHTGERLSGNQIDVFNRVYPRTYGGTAIKYGADAIG